MRCQHKASAAAASSLSRTCAELSTLASAVRIQPPEVPPTCSSLVATRSSSAAFAAASLALCSASTSLRLRSAISMSRSSRA